MALGKVRAGWLVLSCLVGTTACLNEEDREFWRGVGDVIDEAVDKELRTWDVESHRWATKPTLGVGLRIELAVTARTLGEGSRPQDFRYDSNGAADIEVLDDEWEDLNAGEGVLLSLTPRETGKRSIAFRSSDADMTRFYYEACAVDVCELRVWSTRGSMLTPTNGRVVVYSGADIARIDTICRSREPCGADVVRGIPPLTVQRPGRFDVTVENGELELGSLPVVVRHDEFDAYVEVVAVNPADIAALDPTWDTSQPLALSLDGNRPLDLSAITESGERVRGEMRGLTLQVTGHAVEAEFRNGSIWLSAVAVGEATVTASLGGAELNFDVVVVDGP